MWLGVHSAQSQPPTLLKGIAVTKSETTSDQDFTPALGKSILTPLYDCAISLLTLDRVWRSRVVSAVAPTSNDRILDVGCGTGTLAINLARAADRSVSIHGLDPDPNVLMRAEGKSLASGVRVQWHEGFLDREFLGTQAPFNTVLSSLVLHQTPLSEKRRILCLANEALVERGRLVVADYGLQETATMRFLFRQTVQRIDGVIDTQPNADGILPELIEEAGFLIQYPLFVLPTLTGSISLIVASKI